MTLCMLVEQISKSDVVNQILEYVRDNKPSKQELQLFKHRLGQQYHLKSIPTDIELLLHVSSGDLDFFKQFLLTKPVRSISGVSPIAIMSWPYQCKHGACTMCPSMTSQGIPQSYTGVEPSTRRGIRNNFDPFLMIWNRLEQYVVTGHSFDKVEIIIQGGTFLSFPQEYQDDYILHVYKSLNDFSRMFVSENRFDFELFKIFFELPGDIGNPQRTQRIQEKVLGVKYASHSTLDAAQEYNDKYSYIKCVGLTIETKPDWGFIEHGLLMLKYGCTRVELGVQSVYEDVIALINRGHTIADTIRSIRELKDLGFKINVHYMPGLPGVKDASQDLEGMKELFANPNYRPDMLKLYPCLVVKESRLYRDWLDGRFKPISTREAASLIAEFKRDIPRYCRVMRIQRDIPTYMAKAGVDRTNLRQYVLELQKERGIVCQCIRCREIKSGVIKNPQCVVMEYEASGGREFFVSIESEDKIVGFVRLRFPSQSLCEEISLDAALIRELHVFGKALQIGKGDDQHIQHRGFGRMLMQKAEEIAISYGKSKMVVISGVGVRGYYYKLGYENKGPYMVKRLGVEQEKSVI